MATTSTTPTIHHTHVVSDGALLNDVEMLLSGAFAPLGGFMTAADYASVLDRMVLADDSPFPLPIVYPVPPSSDVRVGDTVRILNASRQHLATLHVSDAWTPDLDAEWSAVFGRADGNHPYVAAFRAKFPGGATYLGGRLEAGPDPFDHFYGADCRFTPSQMRDRLASSLPPGTPVVGFQTRNPLHNCHLELMRRALRAVPNGVLLLQPIVGTTQSGDVPPDVRLACYREAVSMFPPGKVILNILPLAMRMAGPREAVWHALIRRNYGCTHFVVGRDHAGPSAKTSDGTSFFGPLDAQALLRKWAPALGIEPITISPLAYVPSVGQFLGPDEYAAGEATDNISGTELRRRLKCGEDVPAWFSPKPIVDILKSYYGRGGMCVYFVGLSGAGKSTIAEGLREALRDVTSKPVTILDGDVVRTRLSKGLGFSAEDRSTNVRRIGYVASEIVKHGGIALVANIAPFAADRLANRAAVEAVGGTYVQVHVSTPLADCEARDVKGLYAKVRAGVIGEFTGISSPFEAPEWGIDAVEGTDLDVSTSCPAGDSVRRVLERVAPFV